MMVLGQKRNNPYSVAVMTQAWNNLYDPDVTALPATDLYVRFLPADLQEYKELLELEETRDLDFDDYPLDYEIIEEGGWYHDPSIPDDRPTWQYTVVPPNFEFPNIHYEILEELVLAPYYSYLTAEAYRITGNDYESEGNPEIPCDPQYCGSWPCCLLVAMPCNEPCGNDPACVPGAPDWPKCLEIIIGGGGGGGQSTNDCDCPIPSNTRFPAGCIQVEDTQLGNEGVRHLKVVVKDGLFQRVRTETDDNGCFLVEKQHSKKVKIKIKFQNEKARFRAIRELEIDNILEYAQVMKHRIILNNPPYNNVHVLYNQNNNLSSHERARWYASTGNNALHEYYEFAGQDGITLPPQTLDVLITPSVEGEAAPMFDEMSVNPLTLINGTAQLYYFMNWEQAWPPFTPGLGAFTTLLTAYLAFWAPDIVYNHGGENEPSDQIKDTYYHEFAHASHYNALNSNQYWMNNILYVWDQGGYGNGTQPGAGRCAVIEMWGFHMGPTYADRQYELDHSFELPSAPLLDRQQNRHVNRLERRGDYRIIAGFIPGGLCHDLIDDNFNPLPGASENVNITNDDVTGYQNASIFTKMTSNISSPSNLRDQLKTVLPTGITGVDIDDLFSDYGW